jgi:hypothetical protein
MRNNVTFQYPAEFVPVPEDDGILSVAGTEWFIQLLQRIDHLSVEKELCQEDWGVVAFAQRNGKRFWVGVSFWPEGEHAWIAHFHHHSFALLQRWSAAGKREFERLVNDFHSVLATDPKVHNIAWYRESDMKGAHAPSSATPHAR